MEFLPLVKAIAPERILRPLADLRAGWNDARSLRRYARRRCLPPPHAVKSKRVIEYAEAFGLRVLVETGTFRGDMVRRALGRFRCIVSTELDAGLCAAARRRFARRPHVEVLEGDSARLLSGVLEDLDEPALFWLDAHHSGPGTAGEGERVPLEQEVRAIVAHPIGGHVILIDDARLLGTGGFPRLQSIVDLVSRGGYRAVEAEDIVRCTPDRAAACRGGRP